MIRKSMELCKCFRKINKKNEFDLYRGIISEGNQILPRCPSCGAPASAFHKDGHYLRQFICYQNDQVDYHEVNINCVECSSCGHSHAVFHNCIVPYSSYSIGFIVHLLYQYLTKHYKTIDELCLRFEISITTFYRIYRCFKVDSILIKAVNTILEYLNESEISTALCQMMPESFYYTLTKFSCMYGFPFMQQKSRIRLINTSAAPPSNASR